MSFSDTVDYSTSLNYSTSEGLTTSSDTQQGKFLAALWGYGGPNCDAEITALTTSATDLTPQFKVKSTGAAIAAATQLKLQLDLPVVCNASTQHLTLLLKEISLTKQLVKELAANPDYNAATANDPALIRWLIDKRQTESTSESTDS